MAFFAAAGASLQLDVLAAIGVIALLLAFVRIVFIWGTTEAVTRAASLTDTPARFVWMGLISHAGVNLGLTSIVAAEFQRWGQPAQTLVVA